jgi:NAD(P)-dependent dehydrogenase (short-subunit alcohol dehydrogenase family)
MWRRFATGDTWRPGPAPDVPSIRGYNAAMSITTAYEAFIMAMERVERRLKQVTAALAVADIPLRRVGRPEDVGDMLVFLASEQARSVTGQLIYVHGGHRMGLGR